MIFGNQNYKIFSILQNEIFINMKKGVLDLL